MKKTLKGKSCKVVINTAVINDMAKIITDGIGGDLQKFIDLSIARHSDPYAPSDFGALRKSVFTETIFGLGRLIYSIYGNPNGRNTWNDYKSKFQDAPMRGPECVRRWWNGGGAEKLKLEIDRYIKQRIKNGR